MPDTGITGQTRRLSDLLGRPVADNAGEPLGRLADVIVRLRGSDYPVVTGIVVTLAGKREVFVPIEDVGPFDGEVLNLTTAKLDLRHFERREGEVLLSADVLGHRMIDVANARLVRAWDLRLHEDGGGWGTVWSGRTARLASAPRPPGPRPARSRRRSTLPEAPVPRLQLGVADRAAGSELRRGSSRGCAG